MKDQYDTHEKLIIPEKVSGKTLDIKMVESKVDRILAVLKETSCKLAAIDLARKDKLS